LIPDFFIFP